METCFICRKQAGLEAQPAGGYLTFGPWRICHAPVDSSPLGALIIEAERHVLDFESMNEVELASYGPLLARLYTLLRAVTGAERIYQLLLLEGVPHFHIWLIPRLPDATQRTFAYLQANHNCNPADAAALIDTLRQKWS